MVNYEQEITTTLQNNFGPIKKVLYYSYKEFLEAKHSVQENKKEVSVQTPE